MTGRWQRREPGGWLGTRLTFSALSYCLAGKGGGNARALLHWLVIRVG